MEQSGGHALAAGDALDLLDWKRRVFELYREIREARDPYPAWLRWRAVRDELFRSHPQSPLPPARRRAHEALPFFPYDPAWRLTGELADARPEERALPASTGGTFAFTRVGIVRLAVPSGAAVELELAWNEGYGGGLFLAFADETSGEETYAGGRYLLDTVKGADLGSDGRRLVLDLNFAYNPSCSYDSRWACPLAPAANALPVPVRAGERVPA